MDFIHMYIMDLLLNESPWLNSSAACDLINGENLQQDFDAQEPEDRCCVCETQPFMFERPTSIRNLTTDDVVGSYGHYAYGNASVEVDADTDQLLLVYGKEGK